MTSTARPKNGHETAAGPSGARAAAKPEPRDPLRRASQVALIGLFVLALLWCAYVGRPVIVPVVLAWVIATIVLPLVKWMQAHRVPRVAAAVAVTLALALLIVLLLSLLSTPIGVWLGRASEIGVVLQDKLRTMNQPLVALEEIRKTLNTIGAGVGTGATLKVEAQSDTMVATIFSIVTPAVSQFVLCIGALVFYLVYQQRLRNALVYFLRDRDTRLATLRALSDIDEQMTTLHRPGGRCRHSHGRGTADIPDAYRGRRGPRDLSRHSLRRGPVSDAGPDGAPAGAQSVRGISGRGLLHVALGACRRVRGRAAADRAQCDAKPRTRRAKARAPRVNELRTAALSLRNSFS
jgi:hypothetical protein